MKDIYGYQKEEPGYAIERLNDYKKDKLGLIVSRVRSVKVVVHDMQKK
jgi:hypothetical protein